jgi:phosphatidylinositol glycan class N
MSSKLLAYFLSSGPCCIILAFSVEGLFFVAYSTMLLCWVVLERTLKYPDVLRRKIKEKEGSKAKIRFEDVRPGLAVLAFVHLGFFGFG